jgi:outer membrane protein OmpA-like peptidoglycan-associated protein
MKQLGFAVFFLALLVKAQCQIVVIGHNLLNGDKLLNTQIQVRDGDKTLQSFNTKNSNDFKIKLDFGKIYRIYFQNTNSPVMFMEVMANNIPEDKQKILMTHELNVPFYYKNDEDVDTTVFSKSFHRIVFNGATKMVDDTAYSNAFDKRIIKSVPVPEYKDDPKAPEMPVLLTGRAILNNDVKLPLTYKTVVLSNKNGQVIKTTKTNRFGAFCFTGVKFSDVSKIKIEAKENDLNGGQAGIINSNGKQVATAKCASGVCELNMNTEQLRSLIDNGYTSNIGGKLVMNSAKQKKFYSNKTVYLSNKRNTVIQKTKTNVLGTFVFEDIRPDNTYYVGVDGGEVNAGEKVDFLNKDDKLVASLDTTAGGRKSLKINTNYNSRYNDISISDDEMKMNVNAKIFGDNTTNPIGKLKILLLNDSYQVIDSTITDDFGSFRFKYLPFLKRFYLSAENTNNILDVFNNILVYSSEDNLIKIMTHEKGGKFQYKPMMVEMSKLKDIEIDDPWLDLVADNKPPGPNKRSIGNKTIIENILFETNKYDLLPQAVQILDKVVLVMNTNKKIKLELSAHTDSKGNDADNLKLSQLRAKTVREYITNAGIDPSRIVSVGYGETRLLNKCKNDVPCSELEHAQNRRVEFKILEE